MDMPELGPLWLSLQLAASATAVLLVLGTPLVPYIRH